MLSEMANLGVSIDSHTFITYSLSYTNIMQNQRRIGEALMIASGIGVAAAGLYLGVMPLLYGGLAIAGLGIFSVFWDW
jgi:hypothetical protein